VQRRGPRGDDECVRDLADASDLRLELAHLRAHREHPTLEVLRDLCELRLTEVGPA
jgi:hypothetical protein